MSSLVQPAAVAALANVRLRDASESLSRKLNATTVNVKIGGGALVVGRTRFGPTERRVLGLVQAASSMLGGGDPAPVPEASPLFPGPSRFAVLGSAGFELAGYADLFSPGGDWRSGLLRRGTPDPHRSLVVVPTTTLVKTVGTATTISAGHRPAAERDAATQRAEAFAVGMAAGVAHGVVFGPVQRGERQRLSGREWTRHEPGSMLAAADRAVLTRLVGGPDPAAQWRRWWPSAAEAAPFWPDLYGQLDATYAVDHRSGTALGWPSFESALKTGSPLSAASLGGGYERLLADSSPWGMGAWFGVLTPFLLSPTLSLLLGLALPHGRRFFSPNDPLTDRSFTELFSLASSVSSIAPFVTSMVMWANVPDHTEAFVEALVLFLVRAGLFAGWLPTIGSETDDPSPAARWAIAGGMLGTDVYAMIRALLARGGEQPGRAVVFGVQTIPGVLALSTLIQGALIKGAVAATKAAGGSDTAASVIGGIALGLTGLGTWLGVGLPLAHSLAQGGGWLSWFRTTPQPSLLGPITAATAGEPSGQAALFDDSTLWNDPANANPARADLRYPTAGRPLVKAWRSGSDNLEISQAGHVVRIRNGANVQEVQIGPGKRSVTELVAALAAVPGVQAAPVDTTDAYDLPWPATLSDPAVDRDPALPAADPAHTAFTALPTSADHAFVIRHSSGADLTTPFGLTGPSGTRFDGVRLVPQATLGDVEDTALGAAADLALLLSLGLASRLRTVVAATPNPDPTPLPGVLAPIDRIFRDWNLDDRRVNEWRMLVAGGAAAEDNAPAADDADGERVANALGWVPLWRAWVRMASDPTQDALAAIPAPYAPTAQAADGQAFTPTNAQLSAGIRYLLELPAP